MFPFQTCVRGGFGCLPKHRNGASSNQSRSFNGHRQRRARRCAAWGYGYGPASAALLGGQSVTSEAGGEYRFPSLPAGAYTLTFELRIPDFEAAKTSSSRPGRLCPSTGRSNSASLQETITVTGQSPVVDKQSTAVGYVQTTAQLVGVPTSTDLWGRPRADSGRAHARRGCGRQSQEPAARVTKLSALSIRLVS